MTDQTPSPELPPRKGYLSNDELFRAQRTAFPASPIVATLVGAPWWDCHHARRRSRFDLLNAVAEGFFALGKSGVAFEMLALGLDMSQPGRQSLADEERRHAIDRLARMATTHLAVRDAEPRPDMPQPIVDAGQAALWLLRTDDRHWVAAQRLLLRRTEALRCQVACGVRELHYVGVPDEAVLVTAFDRMLIFLRLASLADVAALGLAPDPPEQPRPPGYDSEETA